jgi:hypothetical protein
MLKHKFGRKITHEGFYHCWERMELGLVSEKMEMAKDYTFSVFRLLFTSHYNRRIVETMTEKTEVLK